MRSINRVAVLGVVVTMACAVPATARIFDLVRCHSLAMATFLDNGHIETAGAWPPLRSFIVDTTSGRIRFPDMQTPWQWEVVQHGSEDNDAVLVVPSIHGVAPPSILRVRQWKIMAGITFAYYDLSFVVTGTCEPVR